jgi:AraC-like DNA-binding protein
VPADERVDGWNEIVAARFGGRVVHHVDAPFHGTARITALGPLSLLELNGCAHSLDPTATPGGKDGLIGINAQLSGAGIARSRHRDATVRAGQLGMIDAGLTQAIELPEDYHQLLLTVPTELLAPRLSDPAGAHGRVVEGLGCAGVVLNRISYLARHGHELDTGARRQVADHLLDMLILTFGPATTAAESDGRRLLLQAALDEMERRADDPALTADDIARHVNISVRYLQRLLAEHGTTFGRWVLERRLQHAQATFDADPQRRRTVADVAHSHGFIDRSHFSRAFTAAFGISPREYRRHLGAH